jgi:hypothetical protein
MTVSVRWGISVGEIMADCADTAHTVGHLPVQPLGQPASVPDGDLSQYVQVALMDGGAQTSTCHLRYVIHKFEVINFEKRLYDAGNHMNKAQGQGYLKIVASQKSDNEDHFSLIHIWFTTTLPSIIISPGEIVRWHPTCFDAYSSYSNPSKNAGHVRLMGYDMKSDLYLPGRTKHMLLRSLPLIPAPVTAGLRVSSLTV